MEADIVSLSGGWWCYYLFASDGTSECDCHRSLHEEQLNLYVKLTSMERQVQQMDYGITQIKTMHKAEMDELKMAINKTRLNVEGMYVN